MISLTVERRYGTATVRARIAAPTIERALELCGGDARAVLPTGTGRLLLATEAGGSAKDPPAREFARTAA